jgi:hypothetical protein
MLVGRLSPLLSGSALLLLVAFGCNIMISFFSHDDRHEPTKETSMTVTKKVRLRKIAKIMALGVLTTVADVAVNTATSG